MLLLEAWSPLAFEKELLNLKLLLLLFSSLSLS